MTNLFTDQFFKNLCGFTLLISVGFTSIVLASEYGVWQGLMPWVLTIMFIVALQSSNKDKV